MMKPKDGSTISISGHDYTLRYVKDLKKGDQALYGWYRPDEAEILIEPSQPERSKQNTLIHEVVHGILEHAGWSGRDDEERIANTLAYGLQSVRINGKPLLR